jgi:hypothetical protein
MSDTRAAVSFDAIIQAGNDHHRNFYREATLTVEYRSPEKKERGFGQRDFWTETAKQGQLQRRGQSLDTDS